jgi:7,8-dihydropterin-6-yl-methyl-4-(beta-D-ribofuranosyl)aminobenzene 5'-phosphate synthase
VRQVKARVLCENTVPGGGGLAEHGWAVWLDTLHGYYLFDTGQGKSLLHNALYFGVDLSALQAIFLSHHHYDHTGGLLNVLTVLRVPHRRKGVQVFGHPDLFKDSYSIPKGKQARHIGMPFTRAALEGAGADLYLDTDWTTVSEGMYLTGEVPRLTEFERDDANLKHFGEQGEMVSDPVIDDQGLVIETARGLFVVLGCSHAGVVNTLRYAAEKTGSHRFHTVMGGFHLGGASEAHVTSTIHALKEFEIEHIGAGHCTGHRAIWELAQAFGDRFFLCNVGTTVEI